MIATGCEVQNPAACMTILVIEDSRFLRSAIGRVFAKAGHKVATAGDGQQGLEMAQAVRPDVIVLDMMLPTVDGTTVLRHLKRDESTASIPVIVLSGLAQMNEARMKSSGAAAYYEKSKLNLQGDDGKDLLRMIDNLSIVKA